MGWVIGNGESVHIWRDSCLSTEQKPSPMGPPTFQAQNLKVKDLLILNTNEWNVDMIKNHLPQY